MTWFIFLLLLAITAYIMVGYPVLLAWRASRNPQPIRKSLEHQPAASVLLAVHNGGAFLAAKLDSLLASNYPSDRLEIIVASDGSTDDTEEIAKRYESRGVQLLRLPRGGKPAALNAAAARASHPILLFTDVRQTFTPLSVAHLLACFADPHVGCVSGYLEIRSGSAEEDNVGLYWRYERWIRANLSAVDSLLGATGAFYAMRREYFRPMPPNLLLDDMFLPLGAFFQNQRLVLEPQAIIYDIPTNVSSEFRRKVRTLAGNFQIIGHFPQLFSPSANRMWWHFLSYKFGRLLLPWLFLGILISSFFLPFPWWAVTVIPQVAFYVLALLDSVIPAGMALKRLSSPARTVTSMLTATACAISILFLPAERLWKPAPPRQT
ncbi:MAG: glycosyltransferase family 2 protein [Acidobacteriota bacterium]